MLFEFFLENKKVSKYVLELFLFCEIFSKNIKKVSKWWKYDFANYILCIFNNI